MPIWTALSLYNIPTLGCLYDHSPAPIPKFELPADRYCEVETKSFSFTPDISFQTFIPKQQARHGAGLLPRLETMEEFSVPARAFRPRMHGPVERKSSYLWIPFRNHHYTQRTCSGLRKELVTDSCFTTEFLCGCNGIEPVLHALAPHDLLRLFNARASLGEGI